MLAVSAPRAGDRRGACLHSSKSNGLVNRPDLGGRFLHSESGHFYANKPGRAELFSLIQALPKAELHLHIEGTLEPELMMTLAEKNHIKLPYSSVSAIRQAYDFKDLSAFLPLYYQGINVLRTRDDFYALTAAYLKTVYAQNARHVEIFFDPQAHINRGVGMEVIMDGMLQALDEFRPKLSSRLILCFLRDSTEASALETLALAQPYRSRICAVGLDSTEAGHPPSKFVHVFSEARQQGYLTVAHAGEEGPPSYVWEAINLLKVSRIDHGVRAAEDESLIQHLAITRIPLTVCPLSNTALKVFPKMQDSTLKLLLDKGCCVTLNSDDPAFFGGYLNAQYEAVVDGLDLTLEDLVLLAQNSFEASFLPREEKLKHIASVHQVAEAWLYGLE
eukprot:gb/GEZN01009173.1/.p1 GENE.gb/GEZN01009173.1/~~gb/GEZN01009173.1/.p1  ORF type:complete len:402 (-),score=42.40 gb/GEZN01009173.1/:148-1317(-)